MENCAFRPVMEVLLTALIFTILSCTGATTEYSSDDGVLHREKRQVQSSDSVEVLGSVPVPAFISDTVTLNVTAVFNGTVDNFTLSVRVPVVDGIGLAFLNWAEVSFSGPYIDTELRNLTFLSSEVVSDSQVVVLNYNLGLVNLTGYQTIDNETSTNLTETNQTLDDTIFCYPGEMTPDNLTTTICHYIDEVWFTISLQVADHALNIQGSLLDVEVTLTGSSGLSTTGFASVDVQVTGNEYPYLYFDSAAESFNYWEKLPGATLRCEATFYLLENSTAHAQDISLAVFTPYYVSFGSLLNSTGANVTVTPLSPSLGTLLQIPEIDFRDSIYLSFELVLDPSLQTPLGQINWATVVLAELTYRGPVRTDRSDTGVIHSGLIVDEFGFNTNSPVEIGLESGAILDCQLSASSSLDTNLPSNGRRNVGDGWKPLYRGKPFCGQEYFQVDLSGQFEVLQLHIQSSIDDFEDVVTSFTMSYSDDGIVWYDYGNETYSPVIFTLTIPNSADETTVYDVTLNSFTARYVRVKPSDEKCIIGLRLELNGNVPAGYTGSCPASIPEVSPTPPQSYVVNTDTGTIFVCGLSGVGSVVLCSRSDDDGVSWMAVDDNISHILAVITNTTIAIGKSHDNDTYHVSEDDGVTWNQIDEQQFQVLQSRTGYLESVTLPYEDYRGQSYNNMYSTYGMDGEDFSLTGIFQGVAVNPTPGNWGEVAWWGTDDWSLLA